MAGEADAIEIPGFALLEIGAAPNWRQVRESRLFAVGLRLEDQGAATAGAVSVVDHFHVVALAQVVDRGCAGQIIESQFVAYEAATSTSCSPWTITPS